MASFGVTAATSSRLVSTATTACRVRRPKNITSPRINRNGRVVPITALQDSTLLLSTAMTVRQSSSATSSSSLSDRGVRGPLSSPSSAGKKAWLGSSSSRSAPISTAASDLYSQQAADSDGSNMTLIAAFMACALSYAAATATTASNVHAEPILTNPSAKFKPRTGGGGEGGPPKQRVPTFLVSREQAEEDIKALEEQSLEDSYIVSQQAFQGARWTMEDTYVVENGGRFVAVFDGHGGADVSVTLKNELFEIYTKELAKKHRKEQNEYGAKRNKTPSQASHIAALTDALEKVEDMVIQRDDMEYQGSTAVCVVTHVADDGARTLLSANVGDSRAILSRSGHAIDLTRDHKPNDEQERERITAMGEEIEWDTYGQVYRVRDLSLSRAIGDRFAKPVVTSEPEILSYPISDDGDEFILLASDGLWDVMSSQEVVDFVHENLKFHPELATADEKHRYMATVVANEALERGSADNVCVVLVWLNEDN